MWYRIIFVVSIVLNLALLSQLIWSDYGVTAYLEIKDQYIDLERRIEDFNRKNLELSREIRLLQSDKNYIERMIRSRWNFVREDEVLYIFSETGPSHNAGAAPDDGKN